MSAFIQSGLRTESWVALGTTFHVLVGAYTLYTCPDESSARAIAKALNAARASSYHNAMHILVHDLFLSQTTAKLVYHLLFEAEQSIEVQHGKPN